MTKYFKILTFLSLMAFVSTAWAQGRGETQRFTATAVAGMNLAQIDGDQIAGFDKIGVNVGARAGIRITKSFEISTEILFSQKGSQSKFRSGVPREVQCNLNYVEIPIEFNFRDWEVKNDEDQSSYMRIALGGGFSYSRLLGGKLVINGIDESLERFRNSDVMFMFSGSVFFTRNWGLNIRWARSLVPMTVTDNAAANWGKAVNRMITVRALFAF